MTSRYGLLGRKLGHSRSPEIHRALAGYDYELFCVEPEDFTARLDPCGANGCFDNPWWSYAWQCGRLLHAEVHTVSQGGIAVRSGTGYYHYPDGIGILPEFRKFIDI